MKTGKLLNLQAEIYSKLPSIVKKLLNSMRIIPRYLHWRLSDKGYRHTFKILQPLKNRYVGCRCIVIGNGPSLRSMDLSILKNEYTFGLNRGYLLFDNLGFETSFFVSINKLVLQQFSNEIKKIQAIKFLNWASRDNYQVDEKTVLLSSKPGLKLNGDVVNGYFADSFTVTNVALELAYYLGFSEVILIGVDHSFVGKGTANRAIVSQRDDLNHFSKDYFGPGVVWQLPDLDGMEIGYRNTKVLFEKNGRQIVDATVGGKLQVYNKVVLEDYLSKNDYLNQISSGLSI